MAGVAAFGRPANAITVHERALRRVTAADVSRVATKYLGAGRRVVTIIGDANRIATALTEQDLGPVDIETP